MITLIKNADLHCPEHVGMRDILIAGDKIEKIDEKISISGLEYETIDAEGRIVTPGLIDKHVHVTGGGGEFGFESYAEELQAEDLLKAGTTTVVGLLGTDGVLKELTTLYAKTKALDAQLTAWMLTSSYAYPPKTLTGSVDRDIALIDKVVGCKLALSDDRGSFPTDLEIKRLIADCWRGGMTCGKKGILHIHMGALATNVEQLVRIVKECPRLAPHISITHCARQEELFHHCMEYAKVGGNIDLTSGGTRFKDIPLLIEMALEAGVPFEKLSMSSDGRGGIRRVDPVTGIETYGTGPVDGNIRELRNIVRSGAFKLEQALRLVTTNVASEYGFRTKGAIAPGFDADLLFLNDDLSIDRVITKGVTRISSGK